MWNRILGAIHRWLCQKEQSSKEDWEQLLSDYDDFSDDEDTTPEEDTKTVQQTLESGFVTLSYETYNRLIAAQVFWVEKHGPLSVEEFQDWYQEYLNRGLH